MSVRDPCGEKDESWSQPQPYKEVNYKWIIDKKNKTIKLLGVNNIFMTMSWAKIFKEYVKY